MATFRIYEFGPFRLETRDRTLYGPRGSVSITGMPYDLLVYLLDHPEEALSTASLPKAIWGITMQLGALNRHFKFLYSVLGEDRKREPIFIQRGYHTTTFLKKPKVTKAKGLRSHTDSRAAEMPPIRQDRRGISAGELLNANLGSLDVKHELRPTEGGTDLETLLSRLADRGSNRGVRKLISDNIGQLIRLLNQQPIQSESPQDSIRIGVSLLSVAKQGDRIFAIDYGNDWNTEPGRSLHEANLSASQRGVRIRRYCILTPPLLRDASRLRRYARGLEEQLSAGIELRWTASSAIEALDKQRYFADGGSMLLVKYKDEMPALVREDNQGEAHGLPSRAIFTQDPAFIEKRYDFVIWLETLLNKIELRGGFDPKAAVHLMTAESFKHIRRYAR